MWNQAKYEIQYILLRPTKPLDIMGKLGIILFMSISVPFEISKYNAFISPLTLFPKGLQSIA